MADRPSVAPDLVTDGQSLITPDGRRVPCSMGKTGLISASLKAEGDGKTPLGTWTLTQVLYRPDRLTKPNTGLPLAAITPPDGWCDDPADPAYNRAVRLPYSASHEELWRADGLYDLVVITDHNSTPPIPGEGSAIFLHCRALDGGPTAGCISVERETLMGLVSVLKPGSCLVIRETL